MSLRRRHGRPTTFDPTHSEDVAIGRPAYIDTTRIRRERPVLPGIGGELMERQSDGLRSLGCQIDFWSVDLYLRALQVDKWSELKLDERA